MLSFLSSSLKVAAITLAGSGVVVMAAESINSAQTTAVCLDTFPSEQVMVWEDGFEPAFISEAEPDVYSEAQQSYTLPDFGPCEPEWDGTIICAASCSIMVVPPPPPPPTCFTDWSDDEKEEIFVVVEEMPRFGERECEFWEYLSKHVKYPQVCQSNGVEGRVFARFIIRGNGAVTDVEVLRTPSPLMGDAVAEVLEQMPAWKYPGKQRGLAVDVQMTIPFRFRLDGELQSCPEEEVIEIVEEEPEVVEEQSEHLICELPLEEEIEEVVELKTECLKREPVEIIEIETSTLDSSPVRCFEVPTLVFECYIDDADEYLEEPKLEEIFEEPSPGQTQGRQTRLDFTVYPNPASDRLIVSSQSESWTALLYNMDGRLLKQEQSGRGSIEWSISDLTAGTYLLEVRSEGQRTIQQVSIVH